jgi:hypothetical protein
LLFFSQFVLRTVKRNILIPKIYLINNKTPFVRKEGGEGHRGQTERRPGLKQQNMFSQPRFGDNNTDFHVVCTTKSVMSREVGHP